MTIARGTDGLAHPSDAGLHDHHAAPDEVTISSEGVVSIPPMSTVNIDVPLPRSDYQRAMVQVHGPTAAVYNTPATSGYECAALEVTTAAGDGISHGARNGGSATQYTFAYSKFAGAALLSDYIFDSDTSLSNRRIAIQDCYILGAVLRFVMKSSYGGSSYVWMRGKATLS